MKLFDKLFNLEGTLICSPVSGEVVPISQVSDPTFGEEILGKGVAIKPTEGRICAPCDGTIDLMFDTGHAVSMIAENGAEILMHIGLETVKLEGKYFKVHVKNGDHVTKGQLLIEFDMQGICSENYDIITPIVICNTGDYSKINTYINNTVLAGDKIMELKK